MSIFFIIVVVLLLAVTRPAGLLAALAMLITVVVCAVLAGLIGLVITGLVIDAFNSTYSFSGAQALLSVALIALLVFSIPLIIWRRR